MTIDPVWAAIGAAWLAALAGVWAAWNARATLRQMRTDSRERSRPMVAAEVRSIPYVRWTQVLVIRNYGPSIARNVQVSFDPPIPDPLPERESRSTVPFLKKRYSNPILVLTPGMELENIYYSGRQVNEVIENREPTSDQVTVTLTYEGTDGAVYSDEFLLDVDLIRQWTYVESSSSLDGRMKDGLKALRGIQKALEKSGGKDQAPAQPPSRHRDLVERLLPHKRGADAS